MAEIKPFRAWRYNSELGKKIDTLVAPLFDVVSDEQRKKLYEDPHNSIHLSVPQGSSPAKTASEVVREWKSSGVVLQDPLPGIYVYFQKFRLPGSSGSYVRKGFIANMKITDWDHGDLQRHESTMPNSVDDRADILDATQMCISPTHGLYTDPSKEIESYLDASMEAPIYEVEDYQGVSDSLSVIHDVNIIRRIQEIIAPQKIILADGHHRYEGSLIYQRRMHEQHPEHNGNEGYNYHMMYFTNTESDDLRILPTHRLINGVKDMDEQDLLEKLGHYFKIKVVENKYDIGEIILGKPYAFGLLIGNHAFKLRLKDGLEETIPWKFSALIKRLDLTVLHYFVIEMALGIAGKDQRASKAIQFERNLSRCISEVESGSVQLALINQEISIETVKEVCHSGYTLPQKSTYFYPKVVSGFLFSSIHPDEFHSEFDKAFL